MYTTKRLKMLMELHDINQAQLAESIGISQPTLRTRFKHNNWKWWEICSLIEILKIERPQDVFFKNDSVGALAI